MLQYHTWDITASYRYSHARDANRYPVSFIPVYGGVIGGLIRTRVIIGFALPGLVVFGERNN
jgi:hypothetical protein